MKGLMKVCSGGTAMWRGWRRISIAKRVYVGVCAGSHSVGRLQKRWTDTMKECLRKRFGCQARMAQDRSEWRR